MQALRITRCRDPLMWYSNLVGELVPYCGNWKEAYKSREPAGYINRVEFADAEIVTINQDGTAAPNVALAGAVSSVGLGAWVPVAERMPPSGAVVLVAYRNQRGEWRRIRAQWVAAKSVEAKCDSDIGEYDEATDTYYNPEGWYERINNWEEYSAVMVYEGQPSHWMHLPLPPREDAPETPPAPRPA